MYEHLWLAAVHEALHASTLGVRPAMMHPMAHDGIWQAEIAPVQQWPAARHLEPQRGWVVPPAAALAASVEGCTIGAVTV